MKERIETFNVGERPTMSVNLASGQVAVRNGPDGFVEVKVVGKRAEEFTIDQTGDSIRVGLAARGFASSSHRVHIVAPESVSLTIACASADVHVERARDLDTRLASGDVKVEELSGDLTHKSASGDITVGTVWGKISTTTASGDVRIASAEGSCACTSVSGDIGVETAKGDVTAKAVSGDLKVVHLDGSRFSGKTTSGDIKVSVPKGSILDVDLLSRSGRCTIPDSGDDSSGPEGAVVDIVCKSMSGDIAIRTTQDFRQ